MSLRLSWISLGILFGIIEMFFLTLDFLAIGISAIITGMLVYFFGLDLFFSSVIFFILGLISIFVSRILILPRLSVSKKQIVLSEKIIGEKIPVQNIDGSFVVNFEGNYWNLISENNLSQGDTIEVLKVEGNKLVVKKIF